MTIGPDMFTSIANIERLKVFNEAEKFANQQEDWVEIKKSIYISVMVYLAGMGYSNADKLFPGKFQDFNSFMSSFLRYYSLNQTDYIHGGMDYDEAHELIIKYPEFQAIDS